MSKYKFTLNDYHAIEKAEIELHGITVLSGLNGSGKSTISRWLYYIINGSNMFHDNILYRYKNDILQRLNRMAMVQFDFRNKALSQNYVYQAINRMEHIAGKSMSDVEELTNLYNFCLKKFAAELKEYLSTAEEDSRMTRVLVVLDIDYPIGNEEEIDTAVASFVDSEIKDIEQLRQRVLKDAEERSFVHFFETVREVYKEHDIPSNIQLFEDGTKLINNPAVSNLYHLRRAIYIDTPLFMMGEQNSFWQELKDMMMAQSVSMNAAQKKMLLRIHTSLHGTVKIAEDVTGASELHYVSDKGLEINLKDTATGFKTFAYLQRLIENGYLSKDTILMIDEPEVHLHPQWVVEFARLLVLLYKELHVKVLVASHNPDMVAAIQSISRKEAVDNDVHFYIADKNEETGRYMYKDLGCEVEDIFHSFNIALDRINSYGE